MSPSLISLMVFVDVKRHVYFTSCLRPFLDAQFFIDSQIFRGALTALVDRDADTRVESNSKHWFMTSFLQPLPYFVTP